MRNSLKPTLQNRPSFSPFRFQRLLVWALCWTALLEATHAQTNFQIVKSFGFPALSTGASPRSQMILGADGALYGVTTGGGSNTAGLVFSMNIDGSDYQVLHSFAGGTNDGSFPEAELLQAADGLLYGTTYGGGTNNAGTVFKMNTDGTGYSVLHAFSGYDDGESPQAGLLQCREDGLLYGTTVSGGKNYSGTIYKVATDGTGFSVVLQLSPETGESSYAGMVEGVDGYFYGTTYAQGDYSGSGYNGDVFKMSRDGSYFYAMHYFTYEPYDGDVADGRLVQGSDGYLYGTCEQGGNPSSGYYSYIGNGTIYKISTNADYELLYEFPTSATNGAAPYGGLHFGSDGYLYGAASAGGSGKAGTLFKISTAGGTPTVIHTFDGSDGSEPYAAIIPSADGTAFYGLAYTGGSEGYGTAFEVTNDGSSFSVLHNFVSPAGGDGVSPNAPVSIYGNSLYGTTSSGAANGNGAAFSMNLDGSGYQFLHSFTNGNGDGYYSEAALLKASDGFLYGTTDEGGTSGGGTVFKVSADGSVYSVLWSFTNGPGDGAYPVANLIQGSDGALYGTASEGGTNYGGTVFTIQTDGNGYRILHSFAGSPDGERPSAGLLQDRYGVLYGTTEYGGTNGEGTIFSIATNGDNYIVIHNFDGATNDGSYPQAGLLQGADGRLYGTTQDGGTNYGGTVFAIPTNGLGEVVLYSFSGGADGGNPESQLVQGANYFLYGTCSSDGVNYDGTVFRLGTNGGLSVLHQFSSQDCAYPQGGLALAADGSLWGAAEAGGAMNQGAVFKLFSIPEILNPAGFVPTGFSLNFTGGLPNQSYEVQASTDLVNWETIATPTSDATGSFQFVDTAAGTLSYRYYKTSGP
jgi:uncharacterized repeat protein (TIGR03803 family)